jgi:hypothetical protein
MKLLVVFLISVVVGQSISIGMGLLVERHVTPYAGLVTFIACYFAMFWLAWRFAVWITASGSRMARSQGERVLVREHGTAAGLLLGACAASHGVWNQAMSFT